jgi:hypothetical protein
MKNDIPIFSPRPNLTKQWLDDFIDDGLKKLPYATVLVIHPDDHASTGIGKYQYRKLKIQVHRWTPPGIVYLTTKKLWNDSFCKP